MTSSLLLRGVALPFSFTEAVIAVRVCGRILGNTGLSITLKLWSTFLYVFEVGRSPTAGTLPSRETARSGASPECNDFATGVFWNGKLP